MISSVPKETTLVIFAGTTGFDKSEILEKFTQYSLKINGFSPDLASNESQEFIKYYKFDDELLADSKAVDIPSFLENPSYQQKTKAIESAFRRIHRDLADRPQPKFVFLDIHLSYIKRSEYMPPINFANFDEMVQSDSSPIKVVTLIDDAYHIWDNIRKREPQRSYVNTRLRLREVLSWRSVELLQAETIAKRYSTEYRNVLNYEVSVRHPPYVLHNLIFRPTPVCGYMSFAITHTRSKKESVKEINHFRQSLHRFAEKSGAVMFDPVTIDELVTTLSLLEQSQGARQPPDIIRIERSKRWPLDHEEMGTKVAYPIEIPGDEIKEVEPDINNNIRARDFKLIDSSICTSAYRPYFIKRSVGVSSEIQYSIAESKKVFVYDSPEDQKDSSSPFDPSIQLFQREEELLKAVRYFLSERLRNSAESM